MQCLFCSKLLFNPVQINGEFFKNTVMTNLSTMDRKEQRSELRRPGTMSMRCTEKKNGVKEYKFTFRHHGFVAGSFIAVFRRNHYRAATTPYIKQSSMSCHK